MFNGTPPSEIRIYYNANKALVDTNGSDYLIAKESESNMLMSSYFHEKFVLIIVAGSW